MRKIVNISMIFLVVSGISIASDKMYQKFGIKSGNITYKITASMNMMGVTSKTVGKKRVIFSDYGIKELREENKITKQDGSIDKSHTLSYMDRAIIYSVDFNRKRITRMQNSAMMMLGLSDDNRAQQAGVKMLKQMGGKKIGEDKVLGYKCDIWEAMGTKQCIYRGITLKTESNIMGAKSSEIATKIDFDTPIKESDFTLPKFIIYDEYGKKLDIDNLSNMDKNDQRSASKANDDFASMMGMFATASANAGIKEGQEPTALQEEKIKSAMMSAMLPKIKEDTLSQEKALLMGKECLGSADTLKEANRCNKKMDNMMGESNTEKFEKWDRATKREILDEIDRGLESMQCIKRANSMKDIEKCLPKE
jgi:hypothetical protein